MRAVQYAHKWAYGRNKKYYDFDDIGGDCTNFISQAIYAGFGMMNYNTINGWFYKSADNRSPSWSGVQFLYNFLLSNKGAGPSGIVTAPENIEAGDVIQFKLSKNFFQHSTIVVGCNPPYDEDSILISTHSFNCDNRPISSYKYTDIRYIHILG